MYQLHLLAAFKAKVLLVISCLTISGSCSGPQAIGPRWHIRHEGSLYGLLVVLEEPMIVVVCEGFERNERRSEFTIDVGGC